MAIKDTIGFENYERLRSTLAKTFPGTTTVTDTMVDGFVEAMWRNYRPEYAQMGVPPPAGPVVFGDEWVDATASGFPIYMAHATHERMRRMTTNAPMLSAFTGDLPVVRVALPERLTGTRADVIATPLGDVHLSGDHLVGSIELVASKYADAAHLGYTPARVDLVTPARLTGTRFSAIALYLGYRSLRDARPSFYLLEAGTATGEAKMLYFGKTIDTKIVQTSWYLPTPYASPNNTYHGQLKVDGSDPSHLFVQSYEPAHENPYVQVSVQYEKVTSLAVPWPGDLTLEAAKRVCLIGQTMGAPSNVPLEGLWASLAESLEWIHKPRMGKSGT
jgi:hypothetical protein